MIDMSQWERIPNFVGWWRNKKTGESYPFHPQAMAIGELIYKNTKKWVGKIKEDKNKRK